MTGACRITSAGAKTRAAALLLLPLLTSGQTLEWAKAHDDRQRAFLLATRDLDAPQPIAVLQSIYTVPPVDGRALYDLILRNRYTRVLDVGSGRGASAIWMALALQQTGGTVVTVEMNPVIAESARDNFSKSGLSEFIRPHVRDVREQLAQTKMTFDLIFVDIGSDAAQTLFSSFRARVSRGGAIVVHDVLLHGAECPYVAFVRKQAAFRTGVLRGSSEGLAISIRVR